jgi:hypothetical protein
MSAAFVRAEFSSMAVEGSKFFLQEPRLNAMTVVSRSVFIFNFVIAQFFLE